MDRSAPGEATRYVYQHVDVPEALDDVIRNFANRIRVGEIHGYSDEVRIVEVGFPNAQGRTDHHLASIEKFLADKVAESSLGAGNKDDPSRH